jgi:hypothetical protein
MASKVRSAIDFLDDMVMRDLTDGDPASWTQARCPKCGHAARRGPLSDRDDAPRATWVCLLCGVFEAPLATLPKR